VNALRNALKLGLLKTAAFPWTGAFCAEGLCVQSPPVDLQQRHANVLQVGVGECSKTSMRISIFGTKPGCMTNALVEIGNTLSFSNTLQRARTKVGVHTSNKSFSLRIIWSGRSKNRGVPSNVRIDKALRSQLFALPPPFFAGGKNTVVKSKRQHIEEAKDPNSPDVAPYPAPNAARGSWMRTPTRFENEFSHRANTA